MLSVIPNATAPSTPLINSILFGDNNSQIDAETIKQPKNVYMPTDLIKQQQIDALYELFEANDDHEIIKEELIQDYGDIYMPDINEKVYIQDPKNRDGSDKDCTNEKNHINETKELCEDDKNDSKKSLDRVTSTVFVKPTSPIETKYCLEEMHCKICDRNFKRQSALKVHFKTKHKHQMELKKRVDNSKKICDYCGKVFMSSKRMVRHIQIHMVCITIITHTNKLVITGNMSAIRGCR